MIGLDKIVNLSLLLLGMCAVAQAQEGSIRAVSAESGNGGKREDGKHSWWPCNIIPYACH